MSSDKKYIIVHFQQYFFKISWLRFCWYSNLSNAKLKYRKNQIKAQYSLSKLIYLGIFLFFFTK
jgi:hypothetical protein